MASFDNVLYIIGNGFDLHHGVMSSSLVIYVLGHSLGNVDIPYFKAINAANDFPEKLHWYVSYYSEDEKRRLAKTMCKKVMDKGASLEMITMTDLQRVRYN